MDACPFSAARCIGVRSEKVQVMLLRYYKEDKLVSSRLRKVGNQRKVPDSKKMREKCQRKKLWLKTNDLD